MIVQEAFVTSSDHTSVTEESLMTFISCFMRRAFSFIHLKWVKDICSNVFPKHIMLPLTSIVICHCFQQEYEQVLEASAGWHLCFTVLCCALWTLPLCLVMKKCQESFLSSWRDPRFSSQSPSGLVAIFLRNVNLLVFDSWYAVSFWLEHIEA